MVLRRYQIWLAIIFLIAFVLRLGLTVLFQGLDSPPKAEAAPDQVDYEQLAYYLSIGKGYSTPSGEPTALRPPGTSLILLPIYAAFGRSFIAARLWFCLLSAAACLAVAWLAREFYGPVVALVSAAWLALYPGHFYYSMHFLSEVPFVFWLTLALAATLAALKIENKATRYDVIAGICWGAAVLTRPHIVLIVPLVWLFLLVSPRASWRKHSIHLAVQTCLLLAVLAPWVARNYIVMGKATLSTVGGFTFWGANNELVARDPELQGSWVRTSDLIDARHPVPKDEVEKEAAMWRYGFDFISDNPSQAPRLIVMKLWRLISFTPTPNRAVFAALAAGWIFTAPFAAAGAVLAIKKNGASTVALLSPLVVTVGTVIVFYGSDRFRDSVSSILITLAAVAAIVLARVCFPRLQLLRDEELIPVVGLENRAVDRTLSK